MAMPPLSRRSFLALSAMLPWAFCGAAFSASSGSIPVGLELYSVRDALKRDPEGTVRAVAQMGYQGVEFYGPYFEWTESQTKQMRKLLDDLGIRCFSTHNDEANLNVLDAAFAAEQVRMFEADRAQSQKITLEQWQRRPATERFAEQWSKLFQSEV